MLAVPKGSTEPVGCVLGELLGFRCGVYIALQQGRKLLGETLSCFASWGRHGEILEHWHGAGRHGAGTLSTGCRALRAAGLSGLCLGCSWG